MYQIMIFVKKLKIKKINKENEADCLRLPERSLDCQNLPCHSIKNKFKLKSQRQKR